MQLIMFEIIFGISEIWHSIQGIKFLQVPNPPPPPLLSYFLVTILKEAKWDQSPASWHSAE